MITYSELKLGEQREGRRFHVRVEAERSNATVLERNNKEINEIKPVKWTGIDCKKRGKLITCGST